MTTELHNQPTINVRGTKVALGPFSFKHFSTFLQYFQDPEVAIYASATFTVPEFDTSEEDFKQYKKNATLFTIFESNNLAMIGNSSLRNIDYLNGGATFSIIIGNKDYWGQGYGTEAIKLVIDYGFRFLNLHNIKLRTASFNERGQKAYRKAGFKEIGRRRGSILLNGKRYDDIYMDCIDNEFEPPTLGWVIPF